MRRVDACTWWFRKGKKKLEWQIQSVHKVDKVSKQFQTQLPFMHIKTQTWQMITHTVTKMKYTPNTLQPTLVRWHIIDTYIYFFNFFYLKMNGNFNTQTTRLRNPHKHHFLAMEFPSTLIICQWYLTHIFNDTTEMATETWTYTAKKWWKFHKLKVYIKVIWLQQLIAKVFTVYFWNGSANNE